MRAPFTFSFFTLIGLFLVGVSGRQNALKARDPNLPKKVVLPTVDPEIVGFDCGGKIFRIATIMKYLNDACQRFGETSPFINYPWPIIRFTDNLPNVNPPYYTVKISNNFLMLKKFRMLNVGCHVVINNECTVAGAIKYEIPVYPNGISQRYMKYEQHTCLVVKHRSQTPNK